MGVPGDEIFFLISTFFTDSENIYIDYKFNGPFSIEHPFFSKTIKAEDKISTYFR
jgi:hypothetical protein